MRVLILTLIPLFLISCGSVFIEAPPEPPDFAECTVGTKHFVSGIKETAFVLPFSGTMKKDLHTSKPEFWDEFEGTIHFKTVRWNVDWIGELKVILDYITVAIWDGETWTSTGTIDLKPFIKDNPSDPDELILEVKLSGRGLKPAKYFVIEVDAEFYFCGKNQELMTNLN